MQMSLDKSVEHLVAVVYDWSGTEETGGEPAILATARVPFSGLCRILLYMCPPTATDVSSYYYICGERLLSSPPASLKKKCSCLCE
jgi:hypothetical protein